MLLASVSFTYWDYLWRPLAAVVTAALLFRFAGVRLADLGLRRALPGTGWWMLKVCVGVTLGWLLLVGIGILIIRAAELTLEVTQHRDFYTRNGMLEYLLMACIVAPLLEEALYRGIAVPALADWFGRRWAIFLSGPLFYVLHLAYSGNNWLGFHYIVAGWILAWAMIRCRSLWVPVVLHSLGNLLMGLDDVLLIYFEPQVLKLLGLE